MDYKQFIADVPDFPKPGILFKDIMPLFANPPAFRSVVYTMADYWKRDIDGVVALDARGFLFGAPLALELGIPFAPVRKSGKLPGKVHSIDYGLEYGTDKVDIQENAFPKGSRILIVDDVLATGGTAKAAAELVERIGCRVAGFAFLIELADLGGREKISAYHIQSLVTYESVPA